MSQINIAEDLHSSYQQPTCYQGMFNPFDYIEFHEDGFATCVNPIADSGLTSIRVNTDLAGDALRNFEASVKRMVLAKLFSPKFAEVILTALRIQSPC